MSGLFGRIMAAAAKAVGGKGRPKKEPELVGSRKALLELFANPPYLPHGARFVLSAKDRKKARQERLHRWQWAYRMTRATKALERYGLDVDERDGDAAGDAYNHRRLMRNARKQERRAS